MPRVISFFLLVAILALAGAIFFRVMAPFILPMFLAAVLVVVFKPLHLWVREQMPLRPRVAALFTTILILLSVLAPTTWLAYRAYQESDRAIVFLNDLNNPKRREQMLAPLIDFYDRTLHRQAADIEAVDAREDESPEDAQARIAQQLAEVRQKDIDYLNTQVTTAAEYIKNLLLSSVVSGVPVVGRLLVGLIIMTIALYYFLADGPQFIHAVMLLSPLDPEYEQELLNRFVTVSRAVVSASLLSAVVQGLLAGIGFYFALNAGAPIFLLVAATILLAIVPFVGAAGVWIPTCIYIYLYQPTVVDGVEVVGDAFSAIALAIYCAAVVSTIDNFIKPWVLHGQSNLHPLLALLSVLGGLAALGPVGLLVGPMIVAFVQALLVMVNKELVLLGSEPKFIDLPLEGPATPSLAAGSGASNGAAAIAKTQAKSAAAARPTPAKRRRGRK